MSNGTHPLSGLMDSALHNLRSLIDADIIIGDAITTPDGLMIIPVSKVSFGFASGGSDIPSAKPGDPFGGGAGGGVSVQPIGFLVIKEGNVELLEVANNKNTADKVVAMAPEMMDKISALFKKDKDSEKSGGDK